MTNAGGDSGGDDSGDDSGDGVDPAVEAGVGVGVVNSDGVKLCGVKFCGEEGLGVTGVKGPGVTGGLGNGTCLAGGEEKGEGEDNGTAAAFVASAAVTGDAFCVLLRMPWGTSASKIEIVNTRKAPSFA